MPKEKGKFAAYITKHDLLSFWLLAGLLSIVLLPLAVIIFTNYPNFVDDVDKITGGKGYNTNILYSAPIVAKVAGGWWFLFILLALPFTATLSGIIISAITKGKAGVKELFSRFRFWAPDISARKGLKIWMQAIVLIAFINIAVSVTKNFITDVPTGALFEFKSFYSIGQIIFIFLTGLFFDGGGLMEEVGWRGFALPRLQKKMTPLKASIILGIMWALWHIPVKITQVNPFTGMANFVFFYFIFTMLCIMYTIVITYFYNRLGGSILIGIAIHGMVNDSAAVKWIFNETTMDINDFAYTAIVSVIFMAVVLYILYKEGPMLGKRTE
ncbi:CPBP family intramembrane metalloprotease [bacterium]|nr:CPBP family intramembrane metalloprotease [bacterium]